MAEIPNKLFKLIVVINWKTGTAKIMKRKPKKLGPWEIPMELDVKVNIPEMPTIRAKGEINIPPYKVKEMFIEAI